MLLQVSDTALYTVWGSSLAIGVIVAAVVAVLLALIVRAARDIKAATGQIWVDGQRAANATVHIPLLVKVNRNLVGTLVHATGIMEATGRIKRHAEECPGCPYCLQAGAGNLPGGGPQ
jgi:hypothetical protein